MRLDKNSFNKQNEKQSLFIKSDILLLGISGGLDSMVLAHLLQTCGYNFHLAHVNFGLRGAESEDDENFVHEYALQHNIPFHLKKIDTDSFNNSISGIQQTARELRYRWFDELAQEIGASYILLAHHQDDQAETILHQFLRGGMLSALRGMLIKNENRVRPLLHFSKQEIESYAKENAIQWRADSSNQSNKYTRNFIRNEVIPSINKINPDIAHSLAARAPIFLEIEHLVKNTIEKDIQENIVTDAVRTLIPCKWLNDYSYPHTLIWNIVSHHGFTSAQVDEILRLVDSQSGAFVQSATHTISKDRNNLILAENQKGTNPSYKIDALPFSTEIPYILRLDAVTVSEVGFGNEKNQFVDLDKIQFPIHIRPWYDGDWIQPLGMTGRQKVSDVLIQHKIPLVEKPNVYVIVDASEQVIAIPGIRISENFKIGPETKNPMRIISSSNFLRT